MQYVIAQFDCGCKYETNPLDAVMVSCNTPKETAEVVKRFKQHACQFQCNAAPASAISVFDTHPTLEEGYIRLDFKGFLLRWVEKDEMKRLDEEGVDQPRGVCAVCQCIELIFPFEDNMLVCGHKAHATAKGCCSGSYKLPECMVIGQDPIA